METGKNMDHYTFDTFFSKNVPHLLERIFLSLDYISFKRCLEVSSVWNEVLTSNSFQRKVKSVFHTEILKDIATLHFAARRGDKAKIKTLLSVGVIDLNISAYVDGFTPLMMAAENGHTDIVLLLLDHGAKLSKEDRCGLSALHHAALAGQIEIVRLLFDLGAEPQLNKVVYNHIKYLKYHEQHDIIKILLQAGANPNMTYVDGEFPLLLAAMNNNKTVVRILLQGGAKPDIGNQYGTTPLHQATSLGHKSMVKQLIDGGADPNKKDIWGRTSLHEAVVEKAEEVIKLLVDMGADPNIRDEKGRTPITIAQKNNNADIVSALTGYEHP